MIQSRSGSERHDNETAGALARECAHVSAHVRTAAAADQGDDIPTRFEAIVESARVRDTNLAPTCACEGNPASGRTAIIPTTARMRQSGRAE